MSPGKKKLVKKSLVKNVTKVFLLMLAIVWILGCGDKKVEDEPIRIPLKKLAKKELPQFFDSLYFQDLEASILQSLVYFNRVPASRTYTYGKDIYDAAHLRRSLEVFQEFISTRPSPSDLNRFIRDRYTVYKSVGNSDGEVLHTGYFEPTYPGSLEQGEGFSFPVYSIPEDLLQIDLSMFSEKYKGHKRLMARVDLDTQKVLPYYARKEINASSDFRDRAEPVVWLANRVDRFFLEIQGSGRVELDNGEIMRLHYAGTNGNAYSSVGKYLIDKNEVAKEDMSMQAIRKWLEANPSRMDEVLHTNDSFVFFKQGEGGPFGSINVAVTPMRSIATDLKLFPRGGLAFIQTALPAQIDQPKEEWNRSSLFVLNQDTGGAIKGPARVDLFCGNGDWATYTAGHMTAYGQLYFLVLKP
ncbi:MAG: MltA domain-containing protein [Desulfobacterales bacterium]|nr:MltA domain-containing protein [Desulfobacterales bacterium]